MSTADRTDARLEITHFTDPACPFAFSAEPVRLRLRWHYGEQLIWRNRMIVLTLESGEAEKLAQGAPNLQRRYGMPIDPAPRRRAASSEPACRAIVAVRLHAPETEEALIRRLRVRTMAGGLLDDPALIGAAVQDAGLRWLDVQRWSESEEVRLELLSDIGASRSPSPAASALDHKLGGPSGERRYTAPSYEIRRVDRELAVAVPGFNPFEEYEAAIVTLAPALARTPAATTPEAVLAWAGEPLATAEIAAITGLGMEEARGALERVARKITAGADCYWVLDGIAPSPASSSASSSRSHVI